MEEEDEEEEELDGCLCLLLLLLLPVEEVEETGRLVPATYEVKKGRKGKLKT